MKVNPKKFQFQVLTRSNDELEIFINYKVGNNTCEKLLGVKTDNKLNFKTRINDICKNAGQKISVFPRITSFMKLPKIKILMNVFFMFQFSCYPLASICHRRIKNNMINRLHEWCLRII